MTREEKEAIEELKILKEDYWEDDGYGYATAECQKAITALDMAIKALEQEPITGCWVKTPKAVMGEGYMWYCNKCRHEVYQDSSRPYPSENYCPNCGAKMDKE